MRPVKPQPPIKHFLEHLEMSTKSIHQDQDPIIMKQEIQKVFHFSLNTNNMNLQTFQDLALMILRTTYNLMEPLNLILFFVKQYSKKLNLKVLVLVPI